MQFFPVVNHWIHLIAAVIWVGGLAFQAFSFFPSLRGKEAISEGTLRTISDRFRLIVGPLILILIVSGGINIQSRRMAAKALMPECNTDGNPECIPAGYTTALALKLLFVVGIISLYLFDVMVSRRQEKGFQPTPDGIPVSTRFSFILGVLIIFMAAMLRHWRM